MQLPPGVGSAVSEAADYVRQSVAAARGFAIQIIRVVRPRDGERNRPHHISIRGDFLTRTS
jgi:hypothetical protein